MKKKIASPKWILFSTYTKDWIPESAAASRQECWLKGIAVKWPNGNVDEWKDARFLLSSEFYEVRSYAEFKRAAILARAVGAAK